MKKIFTVFTLALLSISLLFTGTENASAVTEESLSKDLKIEFLKEQLLESIKSDYPNATFIDLTTEEYNKLQEQQGRSVGIMAPAPPLSYLEVYAAISSNYPNYEYFGANQLSSVQDHGGAELYIVTAELGYGHIRTAKLNGASLSEYTSQFIDLDGDTIIDGWFIWWDASGYESGTFTYQNISTNYPWNTMSDSIYIK